MQDLCMVRRPSQGTVVADSYGLGYTQEPKLRAKYGPVIFNTAKSLATRFNPKVGGTSRHRKENLLIDPFYFSILLHSPL